MALWGGGRAMFKMALNFSVHAKAPYFIPVIVKSV